MNFGTNVKSELTFILSTISCNICTKLSFRSYQSDMSKFSYISYNIHNRLLKIHGIG